MAKTSAKKDEKTELPGVPIDHFEAGVSALVALRDQGKFLIFLAHRRSAQFIGSANEFNDELSRQLNGTKFDSKQCQEILEEIRRILGTRVSTGNPKRVVDFFINSIYDDELEKLDANAKKQFREQLEKKVNLVEKHFYTTTLKGREARLESTTAACLEDLEFELINERHTGIGDGSFRDPFLRLKVRYTKGTEMSPRGMGLIFLPPFPFGGTEYSFELECDESDIDLLMLRLASAKQRLLKAREGTTNG